MYKGKSGGDSMNYLGVVNKTQGLAYWKDISTSETENSIGREHPSYNLACNTVVVEFNPLPALTLQSARDLNVPRQPKRSKVLLLTSSQTYCVVWTKQKLSVA